MDEVEIELKLTTLMQELQQNAIKLETAGSPYMAKVEEEMKKYKVATDEYAKKSEEIQEEITKLALIRGKSLKCSSGNITYKKSGARRTWNLDSLDKICEENNDIKSKIWEFRTEKSFEPQVLIKVDVNGKSVSDI